MRVLMFGWEFPPYVSGGLGAACEGMVRALTSRGTEVVFVIPKLRAGLGAGQPEGLTYQRAILALENYGHHALVTQLGKKLIGAIAENGYRFTQQFDPFTGKPLVYEVGKADVRESVWENPVEVIEEKVKTTVDAVSVRSPAEGVSTFDRDPENGSDRTRAVIRLRQ